MVDRVPPLSPKKSGDIESPKPSFIDLYQLHKTLSTSGALQQVVNTARNLQKQSGAREELLESIEGQEEADRSHEEEGLATHSKKKKKPLHGTRSARQKKRSELATIHAVEGVGSEKGVGDSHAHKKGSGFGDRPIPPEVEQAFEALIKEMPQLIQLIILHGNPKYKSLMQLMLNDLKTMHSPPTATDISTLMTFLPSLTQAGLELPAKFLGTFCSDEKNLIESMNALMQQSVGKLNKQISALMGDLKVLKELVPVLEQAAAAAAAMESGNVTTQQLIQMGESILQLEALAQKLPPQSAGYKMIKQALQTWGSLKSSNSKFPAGMILGYAMFLAELQNYSTQPGGGDHKHFGDVWSFFQNFNTFGIPGLNDALAFIHKQFPSPSMKPTDWSFAKDGRIQINDAGINALLNEGMNKAPQNINAIANALANMATAASSQQEQEQEELDELNNKLNQIASYIHILDQLLLELNPHVPQGPGGGNYIQKALAPLVRQELEGFLKLIAILEEYVPGIRLGGLESQINSMIGRLPNLTEGDLNQMGGVLNQLNSYADQIPYNSYKSVYWGAELDVFNYMAQVGQATNDNNQIIYKTMQDIQKILDRMNGGSYTPADVQALVHDIQVLMENGQVLSYGDQTAIGAFLQSLMSVLGSDFGNASGPQANLYNVVILNIQYGLIQDYIQSAGSHATEKGLQQYIDQYVGNLPSSGVPALESMESDLEDIQDCIGPNALFQLAHMKGGRLVLDPSSLSAMLSAFLSGGLHPTGGQGGWQDLIWDIQQIMSGFDPKNNGSEYMKQILNEIAQVVDLCWAMLWKYDSLQDLFRRVMLSKFMPEQEQMIEQYAKELKFNSDAASMLQAIMKILTNIIDAKSQFPGPPKDEKGKQQMLKNLAEDAQEISQALTQIETDLAMVQRMDEGSPDERTKLTQQLQTLQQNLMVAQGQIAQVQKDLMTNSPNLTKDLDTLLNGSGDTAQYPGGLAHIMSILNSNIQDYSGISLEEEFNMQIIMSRVQQEWEITTTSMQSLHNAYMTFAKAIYK